MNLSFILLVIALIATGILTTGTFVILSTTIIDSIDKKMPIKKIVLLTICIFLELVILFFSGFYTTKEAVTIIHHQTEQIK